MVTRVDAVRTLAAQAEKLIRSGGFDLMPTALSLPRELELAAQSARK